MFYLYIIILSTIMVLCYCIYKNLTRINNSLMFAPIIPSKASYYQIFNDKNIHCKIQNTHDDVEIDGLLHRYDKKASWNDKIFLYCHGNSGWIGYLLHANAIKMLSKYGSVFLFDYRGYGASTGIPSEDGIYTDVLSVWHYLTEIKKIDPKNIVVYGHSMGTTISSHMVSYLANKKLPLPKSLILEAPFLTTKKIAEYLFFNIPWLKYFVVLKFNTIHNVKNIKKHYKDFNVVVLHGDKDILIPQIHGQELCDKTKSTFISISGGHNDATFNQAVHDIMHKICLN